jgi:drug/metabolite transporter (DMT)-like permease
MTVLPHPDIGRWSPEAKGIALRILAAALAAGLGACVHGAAQAGATVGQIAFFRGLVSLPLLVAWGLWTARAADLLPRRPSRHLVRGLLGGGAMLLNFVALSHLSVAHANALGYLAPILTLPLAAALLGERLSPRVIAAVALGAGGMVAMLYTSFVRPDWGEAQLWGVLAGLGSALGMALVRVLVRSMTRTETVISIAVSFAVTATALGAGLSLVTGWAPMDAAMLTWMAGAGVIGAGVHVAATEAVARAPVSTLAAFDYSGLVFAVALDFLVFAFVPGPFGWLGMALIVGAGLTVALGGRRRR